MFVLGIDPGLTRCGYGVVSRNRAGPAQFAVRVAGVFETKKDDAVEVRLGTLANDIEALLDEVAPDAVSIERIFFQSNAHTAISVAQASGIVIGASAKRGIPVVQYSPNEDKQAVVGHGNAEKAQVGAMVAQLFGLDTPPSPPDVADAMALAVCHLTSSRLHAAIASAGVS